MAIKKRVFLRALMRQGQEKSPKLRLYFDYERSGKEFFLLVYYKSSCFRIYLQSRRLTTPRRLERWIFDKVTRTKFKGMVVIDHKYKLDFASLPKGLIGILFKAALKEGTSKTWLVPLQELLFNSPKNEGSRFIALQGNVLVEEPLQDLYEVGEHVKAKKNPMPEMPDYFAGVEAAVQAQFIPQAPQF